MGFNDILLHWALGHAAKHDFKGFDNYPYAMCVLLEAFEPDKVNIIFKVSILQRPFKYFKFQKR